MIANTRRELDNMIEIFSEKISRLVETNESNLLKAYKNHLVEVSKELTKLKIENGLITDKYSGDKEIIKLGKQCIIFREEAIKLHEQLENVWCEMDNYRRNITLLEG
jgi:hypothetical protein